MKDDYLMTEKSNSMIFQSAFNSVLNKNTIDDFNIKYQKNKNNNEDFVLIDE